MVDFTHIVRILLLCVNAVGIWLLILINVHKRKTKIAYLFSLMILLMFFWVNLAHFSRILSPDIGIELIKFAWAITPMFFVTIFLFISEFLQKRGMIYNLIKKLLILFGVISIPIIFLTPFIISKVYFDYRNILIIKYGIGVWGFFVTIFILTILNLAVLLRGYIRTTSDDQKNQIKYILIGFSLFFIANVIFNIIYPVFLKTFHLYYLGDYSIAILVIFIAYAVMKTNLFERKISLPALLIGFITLILFTDLIFFTPQPVLKSIKLFALLIVFFISYLLIKNIQQQIKQREELENLTSRLQVAHIKLEAAFKELKKLDRAKSEFISMASHQLRTPLSVIKGYISMLIEGSYGQISEKAREKLKNIFQSNERLIKIVNDLLNISKIELGKMELEKEPTQPEDLIQSCFQEMKGEIEKKGLKFIFQKPKKPLPKINIDSLKIRQVILNLIDNALRYTKEGEIKIEVEKRDSNILISVKDTGEGLTKEEEKRIFEGFTRGTAGINLWIQGAGLGLWVAKKYLELHQGKIWAESPGKGQGSTFFVELPIK